VRGSHAGVGGIRARWPTALPGSSRLVTRASSRSARHQVGAANLPPLSGLRCGSSASVEPIRTEITAASACATSISFQLEPPLRVHSVRRSRRPQGAHRPPRSCRAAVSVTGLDLKRKAEIIRTSVIFASTKRGKKVRSMCSRCLTHSSSLPIDTSMSNRSHNPLAWSAHSQYRCLTIDQCYLSWAWRE
jgi:hypothetical protein